MRDKVVFFQHYYPTFLSINYRKMTKNDKYILSGPKLDVDGVNELVGDHLFRGLKKLPKDKIFQIIVKPYEKITVGEFLKLSAQICEGLIKEGLKKGDIATLVGDNSSQLHASFVGTMWAGGIPNPCAGNSTALELKVLVEKMKPKWIFCEHSALSAAAKCIDMLKMDTKIIALNSSGFPSTGFTKLEDILPDIDINSFSPRRIGTSKDTAVIICSSGTTGIPKGVAVSHYAFLNLMMKWQFIPQVNFTRYQLVTSYFTWVTGVYFLCYACIHGGDRVVANISDPDELLQIMEKYKMQAFLMSPSQLKSVIDCPNFHKYDLSSIKEVYCGGSIVGKSLADRFLEKWKTADFHILYGMTETGFIGIPTPNQPMPSCGRPFYDVKVKIVDPESGKVLGPNETGEIHILTPGVFTEYVGNEQSTKETIVDGWVRSGDLGHFNEDGFLFVTSRIKELLKFRNFQISPSEIEIFISTLPGVADVGVAGIPVSEDSFILMALVVKLPNATITEQDIRNRVAENFSEQKHLKAGVYFIDKCPRSAGQKLKRIVLKDMAMELYKKAQACAK